jgi:hypothetical protein
MTAAAILIVEDEFAIGMENEDRVIPAQGGIHAFDGNFSHFSLDTRFLGDDKRRLLKH